MLNFIKRTYDEWKSEIFKWTLLNNKYIRDVNVYNRATKKKQKNTQLDRKGPQNNFAHSQNVYCILKIILTKATLTYNFVAEDSKAAHEKERK